MSNSLPLIPVVITTGLMDGLSPCVIAILIFFVAFLITLKKSFKNIFGLGLLYISIVFLTYLAVGVGLFSGIMLFGNHHFFAQLGAWFLIAWGLFQLKDVFKIGPSSSLGIPDVIGKRSKNLLEKATVPAVVGAAFLVGLCAVPCSAGVYAAITSLLASQTTYWTGLLYLILYNLMVVVPLLVLLILAVNPVTLAKLAEWRSKNERGEKLFMGTLMILLGIGILLFLI